MGRKTEFESYDALRDALLVLGRDAETDEVVYHHGEAVAPAALMAADFRYSCYKLAGNEWAFGWKEADLPEAVDVDEDLEDAAADYASMGPMVTVEIRSDSSAAIYKVAVDTKNDEAIACSCPAGQKRTPCKHLYRARVRAGGSFAKAVDTLIERGVAADKHAVLKVYKQRVEESNVNDAIASIIRAAFGVEHPHGVPPKKSKGGRYF